MDSKNNQEERIYDRLRRVNEGLRKLYTEQWEHYRDDKAKLADIKNIMRKQIHDTFVKDYLKFLIAEGAEARIEKHESDYDMCKCAYNSFHEEVYAALDGLERLYTGHRCGDYIKPLSVDFDACLEVEERKIWMTEFGKTEEEYKAEMLKRIGHAPTSCQAGRKTEYTPTLQTADAEAAWRQSTLDEFRKMVAIRNWNNRLRKGTVKGDYIAYDGTVTEYVGSRLHDPWTHEYSTEICRQYGRWINTEDARRILGGVKVRQGKFDGFCREVHEIMKDNDTSIKSAEGKEDAA